MKKSKGKLMSSKSGDFAKGGSGGMSGKKMVAPSQPGKVSSSPPGGDNGIKHGGGKASMAGFTGVKTSKKC
jgi:hypothetical protein